MPASKKNVYEVEKIIDKRIEGSNVSYLVKWKNFSDAENTWEPARNLTCDDLVGEYEKASSNGKGTRRTVKKDDKLSTPDVEPESTTHGSPGPSRIVAETGVNKLIKSKKRGLQTPAQVETFKNGSNDPTMSTKRFRRGGEARTKDSPNSTVAETVDPKKSTKTGGAKKPSTNQKLINGGQENSSNDNEGSLVATAVVGFQKSGSTYLVKFSGLPEPKKIPAKIVREKFFGLAFDFFEKHYRS